MTPRTNHRALTALALTTALVTGGSMATAASFGPVTYKEGERVLGSGQGTWDTQGSLQVSVMRSQDKVADDDVSVFPTAKHMFFGPSTSTSCDTSRNCSTSEGQSWQDKYNVRWKNVGSKRRTDRLKTEIPSDADKVRSIHKMCKDRRNKPDKCGTPSMKSSDV